MAGRGLQFCVMAALLVLTACDKTPEKPTTPFVEDGAELSAGAASQASEVEMSAASDTAESAPPVPVNRVGQKAGLWQLTQTLPQVDGKSVAKICVDAEQGEKLAYIGHDLPGKAEMVNLSCSARSVKKLKDGADIDTVCMINDTTLTSHIHVDVVGNEAFHQSVETRYDPAFAGHGAQMTITDGKYLGACPSNMKPGDYVTGDGVRLKVGKVLAKFG